MTISYFSIATGFSHEPKSLLTKHFDIAKIRIFSETVQLIAFFSRIFLVLSDNVAFHK
jgi:hypothetical protein